MKGAVLALVITAAVVVCGGAAFVVGAESAPTKGEAKKAEAFAHREALDEAKIGSLKSARAKGWALGRKKGATRGTEDGGDHAQAALIAEQEAAQAAAAEAAAAAQPDTNGPNDACPPGTNYVPYAGGCVNGDW